MRRFYLAGSRASLPWAVALTLAAACGSDADRDRPITYGPDGDVSETGYEVVSFDRPPTDGGDGSTGEDAPQGEVGPLTDAMPDQPGVSGSTISVKIVWAQGAGTPPVFASASRFVPRVEVTVVNPPGVEDLPDFETIKGEIWNDAGDKLISSTKLSMSTQSGGDGGGGNTYVFEETPIDLSELATGKYKLRAIASSKAQAFGEDRQPFYADAGPVITVNVPQANKYYTKALTADVKISNPVPGLAQFDVDSASIQMKVSDYVLVHKAGSQADSWIAAVDFDAYDPPLDGERLFEVRAKNKGGTLSVVTVKFVIDRVGPTISKMDPENGDLIGGIITIKATVVDPAGVLDSSVVAVVANGAQKFQIQLQSNPAQPGVYSQLFDTRLLDIHSLFPSISFRASDLLGNQSTVGYLVSLDNTPPLADLDPANVRAMRKKDAIFECSWPFDPVGPDAADDGEMVSQLFDLRARIEDFGNQPLSGAVDFTPVSKVDPSTVELLVLGHTNQPLVVDSNGDGLCDKINPALVPTTVPMTDKDALLVNMAQLAPLGSPDYTADPMLLASPFCYPGSETKIPLGICDTADDPSKTIWQGDELAHSWQATGTIKYLTAEGSIWTVPPIIDDKLQTLGRQFDAHANNIPDGWACIAVHAADTMGNSQVSRVLRVCVDSAGEVDGEGKSLACPDHIPIAKVECVGAAQPLLVTTATAHGLTVGTSTDIVVRNVRRQTGANGKFTAAVLSATTLTLTGTTCTPSGPDTVILDAGYGGHLVRLSALPDCTGTQVSENPLVVNPTPTCQPWRSYGVGNEIIRQQ